MKKVVMNHFVAWSVLPTGTIRAIGHLFAASICNGGPDAGFLAPWVYNYIIGGLQEAVSLHPDALCFGSKYSELYQKVYTLYHKIHYLIKIKYFVELIFIR